MKVAFVGLFCASLQPRGRSGEIPLLAKRKADKNPHEVPKNKGQITYRLPPYTYTQNPEDYMHHRDAAKITSTMWRDYVEQSGQMDPKLNKPRRHYPAHHYRREMKQKIGLQRKEARLNQIITDSTVPKRKDDFTTLHPSHQPRILDAFDKLDAWKKEVKSRDPGFNQEDSDGNADDVAEDAHSTDNIYTEFEHSTEESSDQNEDNFISHLCKLENLNLDETPKKGMEDDSVGALAYDGHLFNEADYGDIDMVMDGLSDTEYDYDSYLGYGTPADDLDYDGRSSNS